MQQLCSAAKNMGAKGAKYLPHMKNMWSTKHSGPSGYHRNLDSAIIWIPPLDATCLLAIGYCDNDFDL